MRWGFKTHAMHKIAITGKFKCCKIYYSGLIKFHCYQIFSKTNNNLTKKLLVQFTIFFRFKSCLSQWNWRPETFWCCYPDQQSIGQQGCFCEYHEKLDLQLMGISLIQCSLQFRFDFEGISEFPHRIILYFFYFRGQ